MSDWATDAATLLDLPRELVHVRFDDGDRHANYQVGEWHCRVLTSAGWCVVKSSRYSPSSLLIEVSEWAKRAESKTWLADVRTWAAGRQGVTA